MRVLFGLVLVVGLGLAGFAVYMVNDYVNGYRSALAKERANAPKIVPTVQVFVAKEPLSYGHILTKEDVRAVAWPKASVPEGAFTVDGDTPLFAEDSRYVVRTMEKDEAILAVKVTEPGKDAGLISRLGDGMRAFTIKVDATSSISNFLRPDAHVDVYWSGSVTLGKRREGVTKLIEQNVTVIAVNDQIDRDQRATETVRSITVRVTPRQGAALTQAQSTGTLTLSLVGHGDLAHIEPVSIDQTALLGLEVPEEIQIAEEEAPRSCSIRTRKGAEVIEVPIPCTD